MRKFIVAAALLLGLAAPAAAQGCGPANPNCVVPTAPPGTNDNRAASTAFVNNAVVPAMSNVMSPPFGAKGDGVTDDTAAINSCLSTIGAGGACLATQHKFKVLGNLTIPANTTLSCGFTFLDSENNPANYATLPAILLDSGHSILAGGEGASVSNCLIYRNGMTFPALGAGSFAGIALNDSGNANFAVTDSIILGFDTCIWWQGARPYARRVYMDCAGVTHAALEQDTGNTDSGYISDLKLQPAASIGVVNPCTNAVRPGTGLRVNGSGGDGVFLNNIVSQNFQVAQFDFEVSAIAGTLWADNINGSNACGAPGYGSSIGVKIAAGAALQASFVSSAANQTGLLSNSNGTESYIGYLGISMTGQDGIVLGTAGVSSGVLTVGELTATNIARFALNYQNTNSALVVLKATFANVNGGSTPYLNSGIANTALGYNHPVFFSYMLSDKTFGTNLYSSNFTAAPGAEVMLRNIAPTIGACTGLGTGTCALFGGGGGSSIVTLSPTGAPAATGSVQINLNIADPNGGGWACSGSLAPNSIGWPTGSSLQTRAISSTIIELDWVAGAALNAGSLYNISYICMPI